MFVVVTLVTIFTLVGFGLFVFLVHMPLHDKYFRRGEVAECTFGVEFGQLDVLFAYRCSMQVELNCKHGKYEGLNA